MGRELTKAEILEYFEIINERLAAIEKYGEILLVGGAALTLVYNARNSTQDIDAIFEPKVDMRNIIKEIAYDYDLDDDWLNDGAKAFITPYMDRVLVKSYSNLRVESVDAEGLLAMKLSSARSLSKDMDDAITLMKYLKIKSKDDLFEILEQYIDPNRLTPQVEYFTEEAFEKYKQVLKKDDMCM